MSRVKDFDGSTVDGRLVEEGVLSALNLSAVALVKPSSGRIATVSVTTAGSAPGSVNDCATTAAAAAANLVASIPNTVGLYKLNWPCLSGIVVTPGTGQVVSVSYS